MMRQSSDIFGSLQCSYNVLLDKAEGTVFS